jgi:hypothetical protein
MANENSQVERSSNETSAVWTLADVDINELMDIQKNSRQVLYAKVDDILDYKDDVESVFIQMQTILEGYFKKDEIKKFAYTDEDGSVYTFYDIKALVPYFNTKEQLKRLLEIAFGQYNHFIKIIGAKIPTQRLRPKKKIVDRLFSIANIGDTDLFFQKRMAEYRMLVHHSNPLNFISYNVSAMPRWDLPCNIIIFGPSRIGKSVLALQIARRKHYCGFTSSSLEEADHSMITNFDFVHQNIMYRQSDDFTNVLKNPLALRTEIIDEGMLTFDNRESMKKANVKLGKMLNVFGNRLFTSIVNIQNLSNLDKRILDLANIVIGIDARGHGLVYMAQKNFALIKTTYGFEYIKEHPDLIEQGYEKGVYNLKKYVKSYVCEITWPDLAGTELYTEYKKYKEAEQGLVE